MKIAAIVIAFVASAAFANQPATTTTTTTTAPATATAPEAKPAAKDAHAMHAEKTTTTKAAKECSAADKAAGKCPTTK
jgi:hypothetical protein